MKRSRQRGAILAFTGIALLTLLGMTVVGVDLGRLAFTATEVQTVAEVAATGYAHAWLKGESSPTGDPGDGACATDAMTVIDGNRIDGRRAARANIEGYERGFYNFSTNGPFTTAIPAGESPNAVRATATATVDNFFASLLGSSRSTVRKNAVATITCGNRAQPLPIMVQDCQFGGFDSPDDCADLPRLTQQNIHEEDSCWTSLSSESANAASIRDLIAAQCCPGGGSCDLPPGYPEVSEGQVVSVINGQATTLVKAMQDCWDNGHRNFVVPITPCGTPCNQSNTISGFANIELTARPVAQGPSKYVSLGSFCNSKQLEGRGGKCFGVFKVAMVE
jgi:hypothetical protein